MLELDAPAADGRALPADLDLRLRQGHRAVDHAVLAVEPVVEPGELPLPDVENPMAPTLVLVPQGKVELGDGLVLQMLGLDYYWEG